MAVTYPFKITTLGGVRFEGDVVSVVAPGAEGVVGVLANHAPMVCATVPGVVVVRDENGTQSFRTDEGTLQVKEKAAVLLVGVADPVKAV